MSDKDVKSIKWSLGLLVIAAGLALMIWGLKG